LFEEVLIEFILKGTIHREFLIAQGDAGPKRLPKALLFGFGDKETPKLEE
jgi:hypothetical protein